MSGHSTWANIRHRLSALESEHGTRGRGVRDPGGASEARLVRFEAYGPEDCALLVDCLTEDRARSRALLRQVLYRHGGYLGAPGSVGYLFNEVGLLIFAPGVAPAPLVRAGWHAGAEDVVVSADGTVEVLTDPNELGAVRARLTRAGFTPVHGAVTARAAASRELQGSAASELLALLGELRALPEVRSVYTNAEVASELLAGV